MITLPSMIRDTMSDIQILDASKNTEESSVWNSLTYQAFAGSLSDLLQKFKLEVSYILSPHMGSITFT